MDGYIQMDGWMMELMDWTHKWMDGWMDGRMNGCMYMWMDGWLYTVQCIENIMLPLQMYRCENVNQ